ncbi:hypothetical protein [Variovorax sp. J31P207]|uniref:hypothetical protein n=1 Tax=Variovorax sp. J31P207 TaxID=3053510 RepID=UPI002577F3DF|nr:hypothetical protein [Variovorax sp. J31P207]MDM0072064.1 hypothetical protein [Variovorax sp. J31P207]
MTKPPVADSVPAAPEVALESTKHFTRSQTRIVKDSFKMSRLDFDLIGSLKERAAGFGRPAKQGELLRAGLHSLQKLSDGDLRRALDALAPLKARRPDKAGATPRRVVNPGVRTSA